MELKIKIPPEQSTFTERGGFDTGPVPIQGMSDPEYFGREVELIWKRQWLYAGKEHYIPSAGDYFVKELPFAKTSIVVVRGKDNKVRAFHNVCSHRCNKLIWSERGNTRAMRCQFHGWVYSLKGDLEIVTDDKMFDGLDRNALGLTPVHCDVWEGFIMINLTPSPTTPLSLKEYFGDFYYGLSGFPFRELTREYKWRAHINANWKLVRDAFVEAYHIAFLHRQTAASSFTNKTNPYLRAHDIRCTEYGAQISLAANMEYSPPPTQKLAFALGGAAVQNVSAERHKITPDSLNPAKALNWAGDLNCFFPSFGVPTFPGQYVLNHFVPVDSTHSIYELHLCFSEPRNASERWTQEVSQTLFSAGVLEDLKTLELTQQVIEGGGKKCMYLQDQELAVRQNHYLVQKVCGAYPAAS